MEPLRRRQLVKTSTFSAGVMLILALLAIVNYFGWKYYKRFDWTGSHMYSLSPKSHDVLRQLHKDIDVVMLMPSNANLYEAAKELLQRYAAASPHIHLQTIDPERNPALAEQLARKYGVSTPGVVFAAGNDRRVVDAADMADLDYSGLEQGQAPEMTGFKGEQLFTGALLQLGEGRKPKVLFTTGHGERTLDDTQARGLAGAREILGADNFQLEEWASLGKPAVPDKTDLVVVAGPTSSFVAPELNALSAYVQGGGRVLVLLDPTLAGSQVLDTGLEGWLAAYGIQADKDIVVDPAGALPYFGPETIFVKDYADHPITKPLRSGNLPVVVSLARSVRKAATPPAGVELTELMHTTDQGWGETNLADLSHVAKDAADVAGPVSLGVAAEIKRPGAPRAARIVVYGDSDFASNQLVQKSVPNAMLLANSLNWMAERTELLGIPPRKTEQVRVAMTQGELRTLFGVAILLLPGLAAAAGIWVRLRRRR